MQYRASLLDLGTDYLVAKLSGGQYEPEDNMSWIGRKRLALVPVFRPNAHPPDVIPPNWRDQIFARALFDPDPVTKIDRSLRAYIHTASSGLADLDAMVLDVQTVDQQDVPPGILEPQLGA